MHNYCKNCGSEVNDKFCTNCGTRCDISSLDVSNLYNRYDYEESSTSHTCAVIFTVIWVLIFIFFTFIGSSFFGVIDRFKTNYYGGETNQLETFLVSSLISCFFIAIPFIIAFIFSFASGSRKLILLHKLFLFIYIILFCLSIFL